MPAFSSRWRNYPNIQGDKPLLSPATYPNQCAINLHAASTRSGFNMKTFTGTFSWRRDKPKYAIRTQEMPDWLARPGILQGSVKSSRVKKRLKIWLPKQESSFSRITGDRTGRVIISTYGTDRGLPKGRRGFGFKRALIFRACGRIMRRPNQSGFGQWHDGARFFGIGRYGRWGIQCVQRVLDRWMGIWAALCE